MCLMVFRSGICAGQFPHQTPQSMSVWTLLSAWGFWNTQQGRILVVVMVSVPHTAIKWMCVCELDFIESYGCCIHSGGLLI